MWRIPEQRMKMRRPHDVPLSTQVLDILKISGRFRTTVILSSIDPHYQKTSLRECHELGASEDGLHEGRNDCARFSVRSEHGSQRARFQSRRDRSCARASG